MSTPVTVSHLTKRFGKTIAVDDLSFEVPAGAVTAFLGANGAGKSTTIQTILNLHKPSSGQCEILGTNSRKLGPTELQQIGYVSENMELPLWMTVGRFIKYCRPFYPTWDDQFCNQLLREFGLPLDRKLRHLSRGMRMKAALLGGIAYRPKLVVLDEPFSGLDPLVRDEFIRGLLQLTGEEGWTVLISSHDIDEVERLADRVIFIEDGRKRIDRAVPELLENFQQIEITRSSTDPLGETPPDWIDYHESGRTIRFLIENPDSDLETDLAKQVADATGIQRRPASIREIFVSLSREKRNRITPES
ncbi:MAG: ABC transporter ATP-binding protein [Verrucomicrobiota bacterium]